eukprot:4118894-Amphidinium_carterae.1
MRHRARSRDKRLSLALPMEAHSGPVRTVSLEENSGAVPGLARGRSHSSEIAGLFLLGPCGAA